MDFDPLVVLLGFVVVEAVDFLGAVFFFVVELLVDPLPAVAALGFFLVVVFFLVAEAVDFDVADFEVVFFFGALVFVVAGFFGAVFFDAVFLRVVGFLDAADFLVVFLVVRFFFVDAAVLDRFDAGRFFFDAAVFLPDFFATGGPFTPRTAFSGSASDRGCSSLRSRGVTPWTGVR